MDRSKYLGYIAILFCSSITCANPTQNLLDEHVAKYKSQEYFSGATLSVYIPDQPIENYYAGRISHHTDSQRVSDTTLFEIGSITKSFTAATLIQLDSEKKIHLHDPIKLYLPLYSKWGSIQINQLLNMTSNLPNYSDTPLWNSEAFKHPQHIWTSEELINFVYPRGNLNPPLTSGYFYSNTGYILADIIVENVTGHSFSQELTTRTIRAANLQNTFYAVPTINADIKSRMAHGYNYNQYDNPALVGKDISNNNLSWAAAAGGIVSTSEDIVKWVKALFTENIVLNKQQKHTLTQMISTKSGKPISQTTATDPEGFALGIAQAYSDDKTLNHFWFYEGETLGFRALYMYVPCNHVIIASIFNSATNHENDHAKELMINTYHQVIAEHPKLSCAPA